MNRETNFSKNYNYKEFPYKTPPEILGGKQKIYPVVIVGAGPIGLSLAIDLALRGIKSVLLDDNNIVSTGSRAICWAKRTLEIFDRLGVASKMMEKELPGKRVEYLMEIKKFSHSTYLQIKTKSFQHL